MKKTIDISRAEKPSEMRRTILTLVWPVILQNLLISLMFLVDSIMVGRLGAVALSASGVAGPLLWSISMLLMAAGIGTMAAVARAVGEGDSRKAQANAATGLLLALFGGIAVSILGVVFAEQLIRAIMDHSEVVFEGKYYFGIVIGGFVFAFQSMVAGAILRAAGNTKTPMIAGIISNVLNIVGNYALIFGKFGFPEMGLTGAGLATAIAKVVECFLLLSYLFSKRSTVRLSLRSFLLITRATIKRVVKIALPAAVEPLFVHSGFILFTKIVATLGTTAMAAHRIAIGIESLGFMTADAFYVVAAAVVGQSLGAGRKDTAESGTRESMRIGILFLGLAAVIFLIFPRYIARMFTPDTTLVDAAALCLMIAAFEQPFMAAAGVYKGTFQGAGDTKTPVYVGALAVWLIRVPLTYLFAITMGLGLRGAWIVTCLDWAARALIFALIHKRGKWKHIKI